MLSPLLTVVVVVGGIVTPPPPPPPPPRRRRHKEMLKSQPLVPGNVSLSGNTAFVVVIKV